MSGEVVFIGKTKKDFEVLIRHPRPNDVSLMRDYINTLSAEKTFLSFQGEQVSLEEENIYLDDQLKKIEEKQAIKLFVFDQDKLIGISDIVMREKAEKHIGYLGISVAKEYRGKGVGSLLMDLAIKEAKENLENLKIIVLSVFGDNEIAQSMYKKFGFEEYGNLPEGVLHAGFPVDHIYMYKKVS